MRVVSIIFLFALFHLWGCGSRIPIAEVSESLTDDRVIGSWKAPAEPDLKKFKVLKFNNKEYVAYSNVLEKNETVTEKEYYYRFYILNIKGSYFLNVQDINSSNPENRAYHFFRYQVTSDSSILVESLNNVDSVKINDFENSEDLYAFIKSNVKNEKLYKEPVLLIREPK